MIFRNILVMIGLVLGALLVGSLLISLVTLAFLGLGALFSYFFNLTLFEATVVTLLGAMVLMLLVHSIRILFSSTESEAYEDWEEEDDEDWYDEDEDEEEDQYPGRSFLHRLSSRESEREEDIFAGIGRNDPCPCGSGRKFKYCHGRARRG